MPRINYQLLERRLKLHTKAYIVLCVILLLSMGFFTYKKWQEYSLAKRGLTQNTQFIEFLRKEARDEKGGYESNKKELDKFYKTLEDQLDSIFPVDDAYTALTRQIDAYEQQLSTRNNPFEVSNISYQTPMQDENFSVLPFRMSIRSSNDNFTKFLQLVENSGSLSNNIRLMDISSIRLNFERGQERDDGLINFSVQINAYFQT